MTKNQRIVLTLVLSFQATLALANEAATAVSHTPVVSATPVASATPNATPSATPMAALTEDEKKKLSVEFKKALNQQRAAMAHQERSAIRELQVAQNQKQKRWREDQKIARRQFFDQHMSGPERREYVQNYLKKKQDFENTLKNELTETKKNWSQKNQLMKQHQKTAEEKFNEALKQGQRPSLELWPVVN